ncbi:MAG: dihydroneopterin aldolase [Gaiellales bacterium]
MEITLEISGLEIFGFHGVLPEERERGQRFLYDITLIAHDAGVRTDKLNDTIDYTAVAACVRELSDGRRFNLIEALAATIADELIARFDVSRVRVRVRKPEVELEVPVEFTAATVERSRR